MLTFNPFFAGRQIVEIWGSDAFNQDYNYLYEVGKMACVEMNIYNSSNQKIAIEFAFYKVFGYVPKERRCGGRGVSCHQHNNHHH